MSKIKITSQETIDTLEIAHAASLAGLKAAVHPRAVLPSEIILAACADFSANNVELPDYANADPNHKCVTFANRKFNHALFYKQNLRHYDFEYGSFREANFEMANLTRADFRGANLTRADFGMANLTGANLVNANLTEANLFRTNLTGADLTGAILTRACLDGACLDNVIGLYYPMACPLEGSFIGWKKALEEDTAEEALVKLEIPKDAKRSSGITNKCRANKAKVLEIIRIKDDMKCETAFSRYDHRFIYYVGKMVKVSDFDENRFNECAAGIHFFIDREEAVRYPF